MKTLTHWAFALTAAMVMFTTGCGKTDGGADATPQPGTTTTTASKPAGESKGVIAISVLTLTNPFFKVIADNVEAEAAKNGYEVLVTSGEFDVAKQKAQVEDFIVKQVKAIILCPCDSNAIGPAVSKANEAGIPVFTVDIQSTASEGKVVCHIAADNYLGGKQAGEAMVGALGEAGGKCVILDYQQAESCVLRVKGFREVIDAHNAGKESGKIDIVMQLPGEGKKDKGFQATEDAIQAHPDLAAIFAINDPSGLGAYAALEKAGKQAQVKIVAFDGQLDGKQAIKDGKIVADPVQFPDRMGQETVKMIIKYLDGEEVPKVYLIPTELYTKEIADKDPELK
jgi:ribose transport system substrate-binding protein